MGLLVDGIWQDKWYDTSENGGKFERQASKFRGTIAVSYTHLRAHETLVVIIFMLLMPVRGRIVR